LKFVLGYAQEIYGLSLKYVNSDIPTCSSAAQNIINLDLNIKVINEIYNTIRAAIAEIAEIRRGFYCVLCDAKTQSKLTDFWTSSNTFNKVYSNTFSIFRNSDFLNKRIKSIMIRLFVKIW